MNGVARKSRAVPKAVGDLTPKQLAVLKGIGDGLNVKEIAYNMKITDKGVEHHRACLNRIFKTKFSSVRLARIAIAFGLSSLCMMCIAAAAQTPFLVVSNPSPSVQLAWNPSPGTGISFYRAYYGVGSGQYTNVTTLGNVTNTTIVLPARGVTYFFAVTAVDSGGLESPFSNEVSYSPRNPPPPPTQKPLTVITVMKSTSPTGVFADAGMNWSDTPDQPQTYYKLKIDRGVMLSLTAPPAPK